MKVAFTIDTTSESDVTTARQLLAILAEGTALSTPEGRTGPAAAPVLEDEGPADLVPTGLDADGLPWDERIHSSNGKQTSKGVWQKRRGVTDAQVTLIEAELRSRTGVPTPPAPAVPHHQPQASVPPAPLGYAGVPAPAPQAQGATFENVCDWISQTFNRNPQFDMSIVLKILKEKANGISSLPELQAQDPATIQRVYSALMEV